MKTQNQNSACKTSQSNYKQFLQGYKSAKLEDAKNLGAHLIQVKNFINAHNRDFKDIAPIKNWLAVINADGFAPRTSKKGNYSLFYTLQAVLKALNGK